MNMYHLCNKKVQMKLKKFFVSLFKKKQQQLIFSDLKGCCGTTFCGTLRLLRGLWEPAQDIGQTDLQMYPP